MVIRHLEGTCDRATLLDGRGQMGFLSQLFRRSKKDPTPDEFAATAMEAMLKNGIPGPLEYDACAFVVRGTGEQRHVANLANAYREYVAADQRSRPLILGRFFAPYAEDTRSFAEVSPSLLPIARNRANFALSLLRGQLDLGTPTKLPPATRLGEHLEIGLAVDSEARITQVLDAELDRWGVDFETALAKAASNLRDRSLDPWIEPAPRLYVSPWRDHYDASRLYLPDLVHRLRVKGDPVAVVPNRLMTIITGSDDLPMLELMLELTRRGLEQDRPVSAIPLRLDGQRWHTWQPESEHKELLEFGRLRLEELASTYGAQKEILEQSGEPAFVASYLGVFNPNEGGFSYATWSEGVETLLPRAERIAFVRSIDGAPPEALGMASFERALPALKDRLERTDHWPPRWKTRGFPTAGELSALDLSPT